MRPPPPLPTTFPLLHFAELDSTNEEAKRRAEAGAPEGLVIWADGQTAGRGRQGRVWQSPAGNLYCSILLRPDQAAEMAQLGFAAALAVGEATAPLLPPESAPLYKWPNDVMVRGRKIAGILLESELLITRARLVVGIGVNIASHPDDSDTPATSLAAAGAKDISPQQLLRVLVGRFLAWRQTWLDHGFAPLRTAWLRQAQGLGSEIRVRAADTDTRGRFVDLDRTGALVLETEQGTRLVSAGAVFPAA
jgi:BirA family transcriptional regulator, biotin operon repressor / biotin---[acetyl-CoA-carboxylase] ligase